MRTGFKIVALVFLALLVLAGATIGFANRPRQATSAEVMGVMNRKVCFNKIPCTAPSGDWFKATEGPKFIEVEGRLSVPRAALKLRVPPAYPKPEGQVEINFTGGIARSEFKLLPTFSGDEKDYMRPRPTEGFSKKILEEWDKESVSSVRTDLSLLMDSLDIKDRIKARELILRLAVTKGSAEQIQQDLERSLNVEEESEFQSLKDVAVELRKGVKDPEKQKHLDAFIDEYTFIITRIKEVNEREANRSQRRRERQRSE